MTFRKCKPYLIRFIIAFSISVVFCFIILVGVFLAAILGYFGGIEDLDIPTLTSDASSQIYYIDEDGNEQLLATLTSEQNKVWVNSESIPQNMKDAFVAIEDERFFSHSGFDFSRTAKALFAYVGNQFSGKDTTFGGSTITQQLVKNLTGDDDQTAARKVREISQAVNLEKKLTKDKILELYMNSIYLSQGCTGVQAASLKFFGKPVSELTLAECASIAGITQYPSHYDPIVHPENNIEKQRIVLKKMKELGYITESEYNEAYNQKLDFGAENPAQEKEENINSYFVDQVIYDLTEELREMGYSKILASRMIYSGGLRIITTMDPHIQETIENVYANPENFPSGTDEVPAQSAMVIMDPHTGEVKGLVGGIGKKENNLVLNRATQSLRQPGSTIKPIAVYAPAMEDGLITPVSVYVDEAKEYPDGWTPSNASKTYTNSPVTVREALARSLNTVPVFLLEEYGLQNSYSYLTKKLGISSLISNEQAADGSVYSDMNLSSLALGGLTHGISPLELTAAYSPFANGGLYSTPYTIRTVTDPRGNVLIKNEPEFINAMSEETSYVMSRILNEVLTTPSGTAYGAGLKSGMYSAGKTGTTSNNFDRWFVGYTPYYVSAVWYGYDNPQTIPFKGNPCTEIWTNVMTEIHEDKPLITEPDEPSGITSAAYCAYTGRLATRNCTKSRSFVFDSGNMPNEYCYSTHSRRTPEDSEDESQDSASSDDPSLNTDSTSSDSPDASEGTDSSADQPSNTIDQPGNDVPLSPISPEIPDSFPSAPEAPTPPSDTDIIATVATE